MAQEHIGKYTVLGEAGRGGMGIVYHAHDDSLDRDVAIKVLPESMVFNSKRMARFQREGKLLASLNHPNIAAIYEVDSENERPYVVLEYVPGDTLSAIIRRGPMPLKQMLPIAIQIAEAIDHAHQEGVIHRDLKPQNVKFDAKGNIKVLDFGLAKAIEDDDPDDSAHQQASAEAATVLDLQHGSQDQSATRPGMMMGTIGYLSPEQACGHEVDKQTDIFSFGCILFEMMTGEAPFASQSAVDAIGRTLHKEPAWEDLPASTPARLTALLRRCLAKEKKDRLRDIGDARLELAELQDHEEPEAIPASTRGGNMAVMAVALVSIMVAILFAGLFLLERSSADSDSLTMAPVSHRAIAIPDELKINSFSTTPDDQSIHMVCFTEVNSDRKGGPPQLDWRLYVRNRDSSEIQQVHRFTALTGLAFSPDGRSFVTNVDGRISRASVDSAAKPIELARVPNVQNASGGFQLFPAKQGIVWFDDETLIVEAVDEQDNQQLVFVNAKTGDIMKTLPIKLGSRELRFDGLIDRFDDDHVLMYVAIYNEEGFSINIATVSLTTGELDILVERAGFAQAVGDHLFFSRGESLYMAAFDPETHQLLDAGHPVMEGLNSKYGAHSDFAITDNGTLVFMPGGMSGDERRMMVNSGNGIQPSGLPNGPYDNQVTVSSDGSTICTTILREDGMWEIWGGTIDPPRLRKIIRSTDADYCYPRLSHDGTMLGCVKIETNSEGVELSYVIKPMDGSSPARTIRQIPLGENLRLTCFNPEKTHLMGHLFDPEERTSQLMELDVETGELTEFLSIPGGTGEGLWSPDGSMLSFKTRETGVPELRILELDSGRITPVCNMHIGDYRWVEEPDGTLSLLFWDNEWSAWKSSIERSENGDLLIGEPTEFPFDISTSARFYTFDNRGRIFSIEPDLDEKPPNHVVVIENWLPSVLAEEN